MITIEEISGRKELKRFVKFPFRLFKNNPYWVPPIISEELDSFDKNKNPVFEHASARFFLALKKGKIVGRVAVIINNIEIEQQGIKKIRFGWFDVVDDIEVSKALLNKVYKIGKENGLEFIEGPLGFSNLDKVGVLIEGFDQLSTSLTWYSKPYYKEHFEQLGYTTEKTFRESFLIFDDLEVDRYHRFSKIVQEKYQVRPLNFKNSKEIFPYVDEMFDVFNKSYARLSSFVPITKSQINFFKTKYLSFINPEYIKFVLDREGKIISFAITMPSYAKAMQKAKGKLFPFGFWHLLKARKSNDVVDFYLIGILPEYQNKGINAIIMSEFYYTYKKNHIKIANQTPELENNAQIHSMWKNFDVNVNKRRSTYVLPIN
ncbi:MAG: GTP cyclohydrolase [Lutimonas sp.]